MNAQPVGYIALLRRNARFRRLWYGQIVSQLGDWFDTVALFTLITTLTGSGEALGLLLVAEFLPPTLVSPFAGIIIDRLPRKLVLVLSDLGRALLVLLFLLAQSPGDVWLVYAVLILKVSLVACFEPARSALLPNIVTPEELVAANGLSSATWSAMLAFGAALGGLVVGTLGVQAAFVLDALTFLLSAWLIAGIPVQETHYTRPDPQVTSVPVSRARTALREFIDGLRFVTSRRDLFLLTFAKAFWNISGGTLLLLTLYGQQLFPIGNEGAISVGLFYMARGVGAGVGPLLAHYAIGGSLRWMRRWVGLGYFVSTIGYLWFAGVNTFSLALLAAMLAHMGGSINWVFSTALLQMRVPDNLRGRVFSVEFAMLTFTLAISSYFTGLASDAGWTPRELSVVLALLFLLPGVLVTTLLWRKHHES